MNPIQPKVKESKSFTIIFRIDKLLVVGIILIVFWVNLNIKPKHLNYLGIVDGFEHLYMVKNVEGIWIEIGSILRIEIPFLQGKVNLDIVNAKVDVGKNIIKI